MFFEQKKGVPMKTREHNQTLIRSVVVLFLAAVIVFSAGSLASHNASAATVKLSKTKLTLQVSESWQLRLLNAEVTSILWLTSNSSICTVSDEGYVKAIGSGTCKITAKYKGDKYTCKVTVKGPKLSKTRLSLRQFHYEQLSLKNADTNYISWTSSNSNVCSVDNSGFVKAVGGGSCTITARYKGVSYDCNVEVTALTLSNKSVYLVMRRKAFKLSINDSSLKNKVVWRSRDTSIAAVKKGKVTPKGAGTTYVDVSYGDYTLSCKVKVAEANVNSLTKYRKAKNYRQKVILAGSSLFDQWGSSIYGAFGSTTVINNAIAKSTIANWNSWCTKLITNYKPKAVVLYVGATDIGNGNSMTAPKVVDGLKKLIAKIRAKSKKTHVVVCSVLLYPDKEDAWPVTKEVNKTMKAYCEGKKKVTYLNLNGKLSEDGVPVKKYFKEGTYVLTKDGKDAIQKLIVKQAKKAAKN